MVDGNEADDKILAVLEGEVVYGGWHDTADFPDALIERLKHYFLTYKHASGRSHPGPLCRRHLRPRGGARSNPAQSARL